LPVQADTDHDGMPDDWGDEFSLNLNNSSVGAKDVVNRKLGI
jgi:hypothetical protein